jgi:hypothetical protein
MAIDLESILWSKLELMASHGKDGHTMLVVLSQ